MSTYDKIAWLPLCGGLTGVGLVLSFLAMRRRGIGSGLRGAAWSLLPLAAYLTGSIEMFWKMGTAIGDFAAGFVFSVRVWSGIAVAGVAALAFVASGPLRRRSMRRGRPRRAAGTQPATPGGALPAAPGAGQLATRADGRTAASPAQGARVRRGKAPDGDDDGLGDDVQDILRRHGIT